MGGVPGSTLIFGCNSPLEPNCIGFSPQFHTFYRAILVLFHPFDLAFVDSPRLPDPARWFGMILTEAARGQLEAPSEPTHAATPLHMVGGPREMTSSHLTLQASLSLMLYYHYRHAEATLGKYTPRTG